MSNKHAEKLCAMMDGELGQSESRFLLKRLGHEEQLIARWKRYHYGRAVLRGENLGGQVCLCERISVAIAQEPTPVPEHNRSSALLPAWLRPVAGFAVAASVAVAALTLMQNEQIPPMSDQTLTGAVASVGGTEQLPPVSLRAQPASTGSASANSLLQTYVMRHNAVASPRRGRDLVPYIYLVTTPVNDTAADNTPIAEPNQDPDGQAADGVNE